jgi:hypothetical protein
LAFGELRLLHGTSWRGKHARKLYLSGVHDQGEVTRALAGVPAWQNYRLQAVALLVLTAAIVWVFR